LGWLTGQKGPEENTTMGRDKANLSTTHGTSLHGISIVADPGTVPPKHLHQRETSSKVLPIHVSLFILSLDTTESVAT
jgi:hypothetical protein